MSPTAPLVTAPVVYSHVGSTLGDSTTSDLCRGLSPCDAFQYDRGDPATDSLTGVSGFCFLPPTVDNHLSDPACAGQFVSGLNGIFKLAWCQVHYPGTYPDLKGDSAPTIVSCQDPSQWQDLVQDPSGGEFYSASVQWKKKDVPIGTVFRLYVVQGDHHLAHRDVVIDPNLTTPADGFVHAIGYGTEPVKVRITRDFKCIRYDTQAAGTDNAATCLVDGASSFSFSTERDSITFNFPDGNPTFLANFEVSECLSLGFYTDDATNTTSGNALVDTPLADCKVSLSSQQIQELTVPGQIQVVVKDTLWDTDPAANAPFAQARLNVLQADEAGIAALPPSSPPTPNWFGMATSDNVVLRWIGEGLDKLASIVLPGTAYGSTPPSAGWDFTRMSDFQVTAMVNQDFDQTGAACSSPSPSCLDLGSFAGDAPVTVHVKASAPDNTGPHTYPDGYFAAPDTRLHFFPGSGTITCPGGPSTVPVTDADGGVCYPAGTDDQSTSPASHWDHLVYVTGSQGKASVDWSLASGDNSLRVSGCGVARPGSNEPNPPAEPGADGVWGALSPASCTDRFTSLTDPTAYDNGPADGFTPFEPVDTQNEVAIYGLPLTFHAHTCPQITIDGKEGNDNGTSEWMCADSVGFSAPLKGPKGDINAWFYTYNDAGAVYVALKVKTDQLGSKAFLNFVENTQDIQKAGDELLNLDLSDPTVPLDWHFTQSCVDNNAASLCGDIDALSDGAAYDADAAAQVDGAGTGYVFYEFKRPLGSPNAIGSNKEDLDAAKGDTIGVRVTVTQGQGGGKGGFVYPDPHDSPVIFHLFEIK